MVHVAIGLIALTLPWASSLAEPPSAATEPSKSPPPASSSAAGRADVGKPAAEDESHPLPEGPAPEPDELAPPSPARILERSPVAFPAYDAVRGLDDYASPQAYAAAVADGRFAMERLTYRSDGLDVHAYLYGPVSSPHTRLPVIVFNRGSYIWPAFQAELVTMANRLAQRGYLVVAPMYRGSGGAAGRDEMGGAELDDLFNLVPVIRALPAADPDELYLYGESRGGMMVYQALRDRFPARAAAVVGAFTDLDAMLAVERWAQAAAQIWPDLAVNRQAIVERRSAIRWVDRIDTPVLILHGGEDSGVDLSQILTFAAEAHRQDKSFELVVMQGEGHVLSGRAAERDALVVEWFSRHAGPAGAQ